MNLFKNFTESIQFQHPDPMKIIALKDHIKSFGIKDSSLSKLYKSDDACGFTLRCNDAEAVFNKSILPFLDQLKEKDEVQVVLEFSDSTGVANSLPKEVITSFRLESLKAFGTNDERELIRQLKDDHTTNDSFTLYFIMSGAGVTVSIACSDPQVTIETLGNFFKTHNITIHDTRSLARLRN